MSLSTMIQEETDRGKAYKSMSKLAKYFQDMKDSACWIGEDGDMVVNAEDLESALEAFKCLYAEDVGEEEAEELSEEDIVKAYLRLPTESELEQFGEEYSWWVDVKKENDYPVWMYRN